MARNTKTIKQNGLLETVVLWVAIIEPLSTLPQIIELYSSKDASSLSLLSWFLFMASSLVWLAYGLKIKSLPLIASSIVWAATEILLIVGIILFS